ncbi:transglycosylase SLT domain-containing protein [Streptomyces sp. NPDC048527]|uniref:LysM peptidoglycan-binding domain-containing protein n=1 Tax=Streptomyces sp. NPDC048527 TaxID=3365568 RepID=UPI00371BCD18
MESRALPQTNRHFKRRVSIGLLVAGAAGVTAPSWVPTQTDNHDDPVTGSHSTTPSSTDVHETTQSALRKVAEKTTKIELVSAVSSVKETTSVPSARVYQVRANDTLSGIARSQLGDASRHPEIFALNKGKSQPGGGSLSDPDVIQVGWKLQLPAATAQLKQRPLHRMTRQTHSAATTGHTAAAKPATTKPHATTKARPAAKKHAPASFHRTLRKFTHGGVQKSTHATVVTSGSPKTIARSIVPSSQFGCFSQIISHESSWNVHATNPSSGAYGLAQSLPGSKMASAGPNWHDDATTQIKWALKYMDSRYGSPCDAWSFWQAHNWY